VFHVERYVPSSSVNLHFLAAACLPEIIKMTKDWDSVQEEIRELSFNQKKPLEDVKELMERKHKFRASWVHACRTILACI
jgi:hypothetical protein